MVLAAAAMPAEPESQKPAKWSVLNAVNAITTNRSSTPSLMSTMIVLTKADSLAPRISSSAHMRMRIDGGKVDVARVGIPRCGRQGLRDLHVEQNV